MPDKKYFIICEEFNTHIYYGTHSQLPRHVQQPPPRRENSYAEAIQHIRCNHLKDFGYKLLLRKIRIHDLDAEIEETADAYISHDKAYFYTWKDSKPIIYFGTVRDLHRHNIPTEIAFNPTLRGAIANLRGAHNSYKKIYAHETTAITFDEKDNAIEQSAQDLLNSDSINIMYLLNEAEFINALLENNFRNKIDSVGKNPIHIAAEKGYHKAIRVMNGDEYDLDFPNFKQQTALHMAVARRDVATTKLLLDLGANPSAKLKNHDTPLRAIGYDPDKTYTQQDREISELFPYVESNGIKLHLTRQENELIISKVEFSRPIAIYNHYTTEFPHCYEPAEGYNTPKLKPGLDIRHKKSVNLIKKELTDKILGKSFVEAAALFTQLSAEQQQNLPTPVAAYIIGSEYSRRYFDTNNVFIGDANENRAYGWLIGKLERSEHKADYPLTIAIPITYQSIFNKNIRYKPFILDATKLTIRNDNDFTQLNNLANFDDPAYATIPRPPSKRPYYFHQEPSNKKLKTTTETDSDPNPAADLTLHPSIWPS